MFLMAFADIRLGEKWQAVSGAVPGARVVRCDRLRLR
jgi:hypothetical protein